MFREKHLNYNVIFQPAEEGGYTVTVPALPGCITEGDTLDEARKMAKEAIELCLECLIQDGEAAPSDEGQVIERMRV